MISRALRQPVTAVAFSLAVVCAVTSAQSAEVSPWDSDPRTAMRLIAGTPHADGTFRAGVEVKLSPGWKTYWRYPGDSGVPPSFDFSESQNVKSIEVAWPAPHAFTDDSGTSIGYKGSVIFPLRIVRQDPRQPAVIRLKLAYAVCEKFCAPTDAKAELALHDASSSLDAVLTRAEASVPKPARLGEDGPLAIRSVRREAGADRARIVVDVAAPGAAELFAEGPTADWALPIPAPIGGADPGFRRFAFALDGLPPGAQPSGAMLKLTLVSGGSAIEVSVRLD